MANSFGDCLISPFVVSFSILIIQLEATHSYNLDSSIKVHLQANPLGVIEK
ncbi:hypothetical protein [uncultured Lutibacter sp.]|uniref:hypothetical protein n=1 Tax=uncultured Lutibacter sp. TaxID=437739 RepID=UPI00260690E2|nr:hypothetical protein [uncultured Lutibacter sp.]